MQVAATQEKLGGSQGTRCENDLPACDHTGFTAPRISRVQAPEMNVVAVVVAGLDLLGAMQRKDLSAAFFGDGDVGDVNRVFRVQVATQEAVAGVVAGTLADTAMRVWSILAGKNPDGNKLGFPSSGRRGFPEGLRSQR